jgi:excisionase family DNA binding protein
MNDYNINVEPMLTTSEVARLLNVHINTVRRWSNQGSLASYRIGTRGDRRFKKADIDQFFARARPDNSNGADGI